MSKRIIFPLSLVLCGAGSAMADVKLPGLFADHLILQRGVPAAIWGWADAGEAVTVEFAGQKKNGVASASGQWQIKLDPLAASSEPRTLTVRGNNTLTVDDVLVGEVWLASGQSNMAFPLASAHNASEAIPQANDPLLRFYTVTRRTAADPQTDAPGKWQSCTPAAAKDFSAVAYFFARELRTKLGCPVAVLHASWGGTPAQAWLSVDALRQDPPFANHLKTWEAALTKHQRVQEQPQLAAEYQDSLKQWQQEVAPAFNAAMKLYNTNGATGPKPVPSRPEPVNPDPMDMPSPSMRPGTPGVAFNAMIAPLIPYAMRGVIWYQGEANASAGMEYRTLLPRLIGDWRTRWGTEFPFLLVQLANWSANSTRPDDEHTMPYLREAQLMALSVPKTGLAVAIDIGDPKDVHPKDKLDVGLRLALAARKVAYGEKLVHSGPLFRSSSTEGSRIRIQFSEIGGGLCIGQAPWRAAGVASLPADRLTGFFIAGSDRKWVAADAAIDGSGVVVSNPAVPQPVAVRYAWANSPQANLYNKEGLPASPFRTDDWPAVTGRPPAVPKQP